MCPPHHPQKLAPPALVYSGDVSASAPLKERLPLASMALIVVAVGLETRFRVKLQEADAGEIHPVADLFTLVVKRVGEALP